jgi:hypothetical protein
MTVMTLKMLAEEMRPFHNDICIIYDSKFVRLLGVHEDAVDLYYYVVGDDYFDVPYYASAVGACVSMKGIYPRYEQMENYMTFKGCAKNEEFLVTSDDTDPFERACNQADEILAGLVIDDGTGDK